VDLDANPDPDLTLHFDADPDPGPACYLKADLDQGGQTNANPCGFVSGSRLCRHKKFDFFKKNTRM
jgi:hypothetical protein